MLLEGKKVFITGCNRGIGYAIVETFAKEGACIWAHARNETKSFVANIELVEKKYNNHIQTCYFDLNDHSVIIKNIKQILRDNSIDILINNAGVVGQNSLFQMTKIDDMKKIFDINFFAATLLMQYFSRSMIKNSYGCIINIVSIAGIDGDPAQYEYSASKAALIGGTKKLANDLGKFGIRVNAIAPGLVETDMAKHMDLDFMNETISKTILKRLGKPEEIANVAAFLASDMASYITGQIIRVDGGRL